MKQKVKRPSLVQASWLRRIALSPMVKTYIGNKDQVFALSSGEEVPVNIAKRLIANGWVRGQKDGMFDAPQTYVALKGVRGG